MNSFQSFLLFTASLIIGQSMLSCKPDQVTQTQDFYIPNADSILSRHNALMPDWDKAIITQGSINILVNEERLVIRHIPDQGNEIMSYFLQTEKKKHKLTPEKMERAEVIFLGRGLIVNSLEKKYTLYFHLEPDPVPDDVKEIGGVKSFKGFGLGVRKITHGSPADKVPYCACDHSYTPPGNCKVGGMLEVNCASSNLDGSCRVTCVGQTYACCDRGFE